MNKQATFRTMSIACALGLASQVAADDQDIQGVALNIDTSSVTVSGLSSGGYMATQFHLAHSEYVDGAALIGTGPYYCGQNDIGTALAQCVNKTSEFLSLDVLQEKVASYQSKGLLAKQSTHKNDKVWILHGQNDAKVNRKAADMLAAQYSAWIEAENLVYISDKPFAHHFPTLASGHECSISQAPFIGNCDYDAAGELLSHLYSDLNDKSRDSADSLAAQIIEFDQSELGGEYASGLADTGYAFVPSGCAQGEVCKVHVSFHGCNQFADAVGRDYVENTGLNAWAQSNNILVLYPQTKKSLFMPLNPQGCWDWWGYTSEDYANKKGEQIMAIHTMIQNLNKLAISG